MLKREAVLNAKFRIYEEDDLKSGFTQDFKLSEILLILAYHHLVERIGDWEQFGEYWQVASGLENCCDQNNLKEGIRLNIRPVLYIFRPTGSKWVIFFTKDEPNIPFVFYFPGLIITKLNEDQQHGLIQLWQNPLGSQSINPEIVKYLNECDMTAMVSAS